MHPSNGAQRSLVDLSLLLMLVTLWLLMRGYHGLTGDAQLYAFQALARSQPLLSGDLYLQNVSQDQFTVFSPLYAAAIDLLGLEQAARLLTILFTIWVMGAAWSLANTIAGRNAAWLGTALLLIVAGTYGGSGVFSFSEPFLTARLPAEALVVTGLALHMRGRKWLGLLSAVAAMFIHPLIALPGVLLIVSLWLPRRMVIVGAVSGVGLALAIALAAVNSPAAARFIAVFDPPWLEVVRERSQFLFLQLWSARDWELNGRPFLCLGLVALSLEDPRLRSLSTNATLLGAAGLAVAMIAGSIGPVAILVQGQAWRWVWIGAYLCALFVPAAALRIWTDEKCGPLCVLLLVAGYTFPASNGSVCVLLALILWATRSSIDAKTAIFLRWLTIGLSAALGIWILSKWWANLSSLQIGKIQDLFGSRLMAALIATSVWIYLRSVRRTWGPASVLIVLIAVSVVIWPESFKQAHHYGSPADRLGFRDWTSVIPPTSTVLVAPARDVGAFVWFTLERPNYLAVDQSAGVVFSRATALEVRRRSEVLLPLMDPNWKILSHLRALAGQHKTDATVRPLTSKSLADVCADLQLGFVISPEKVGYDSQRHESTGAWKDWNLYDCNRVRSPEPPT